MWEGRSQGDKPLSWISGYPFAIGMMIAAAILPYLYFKYRGWL
jgi:magnesium transporter